MMKKKYWLSAGLAAMFLLGSCVSADARWRPWRSRRKKKAAVNTQWEAKADKNKDGYVGPKEARAARGRTYLKHKSDVNTKWETKADTNNDGKVDAAELRNHRFCVMDKNGDGKVDAKERGTFWAGKKAVVDTAYEEKYDADGNGLVSGDEAKEMLRDRLRVVNTHGKARVDTALEREYDANGDGVIDVEEAKAIRDALGY